MRNAVTWAAFPAADHLRTRVTLPARPSSCGTIKATVISGNVLR